MIKISGLTKVFKTDKTGEAVALENVNLEVKKGEIFGIIGFSGAGKSTLIRCINLLETPTSGSIEIDGKEITSLKGKELRQLRGSLGMVFQHFHLLMQRTAAENIAFPLELAHVPQSAIRVRVKELLELVGLSDKADAYPSQLSGGQKQRVAIARALANNPKILLCDEATSALDTLTTNSILALLKDINRKLGLTIICITHEMHVVKEICDKVAVIDKNRIVEQGPVIEVMSSPKSDAAKKLLNHSLRKFPSGAFSSDEGESSRVRIKVIFTGEAALKPVISNLVRLYQIDANILFGNIDFIDGSPLGELILDLTGSENSVTEALGYIKELKLRYEVLEP